MSSPQVDSATRPASAVVLGTFGALAGTAAAGSLVAAEIWKRRVVRRLKRGGTLAETSRGVVEYAVDGSGQPALVFHATPGGYDQALTLGRSLGLQLRIIGFSRPGYLGTPLQTGRTFGDQADAAAALLDALGVERAVIIGASGGGPAALQFALRHPARTAALVLWQANTERTVLDVHKIPGRWMSTDAGAWLTLTSLRAAPPLAFPPAIRSDAEARQRLRALVSTLVPVDIRRRGVENDVEQLATLPPMPLERIEAPTLVVHGTADCDVPFASAERSARRIPEARLVPIDNGTHESGFGDSRAIAAIAAFLGEHFPETVPAPVDEQGVATAHGPDGGTHEHDADGSTRRWPGDHGSVLSARSRWSVLSWASVLSVASAASALSVGSFASLLSVASAGSILSIGSSGSILSIGSSGSMLSIGSAGRILCIGRGGRVLKRPSTPHAPANR